jgi:beta-lactamase superfamily II metal-dependent hydrolase
MSKNNPTKGGKGKGGGRKRKAGDRTTLQNIPTRQTRSDTKEGREKAIKEIFQRLKAEALALAKDRSAALAVQPIAPPGSRGDGSLHLAFVQMGQGDCTMISTPRGQVVMIDCGSDATEESGVDVTDQYHKRIKDTIYGKKFMHGSDNLDIIILTHADTDHYNKLRLVLKATTVIGNIYHSDKLESYAAANQSAWLREHMVHPLNIKAVTVTATKSTTGAAVDTRMINDSPVKPIDETNTLDRVDTRGAIRIVDEDDCKISILASNVAIATEGDNSNQKNRGSVVTLIEAFGKKLMICGDATRITETFLVGRYADLLADLDLLQVPHHGSSVTSSGDLLVNKLKPKQAIISAGKLVRKDHLPSFVTIKKYMTHQVDKQVPKHEIFYWVEGAMGSFVSASGFTEQNLYTTGSNLTIERAFGPPPEDAEMKQVEI